MGCGSSSPAHSTQATHVTASGNSASKQSNAANYSKETTVDHIETPRPMEDRRLSRKESAKESGRRSRPLSRTPSGKEGRTGFVPLGKEGVFARVSGSGAADHGAGGSHRASLNGKERSSGPYGSARTSQQGAARRASHTGGGGRRASLTEMLLGNVTQKMEELLHHTLRQEPQEEEGPDLQIDVGFVFKKALEVQRQIVITQDNLSSTIHALVEELDPTSCGQVRKEQLVDLIQGTCKFSNMACPTVNAIEAAFPSLHLGKQEVVARGDLRSALLHLDWGLLPAAGRASTAVPA